ncbi:MAG: DNA translocase FtsK 4TM domain-containing protein, partial [Kiloniellales bacterium]
MTATDTGKTGFLPRGAGAFLRRRARQAIGLALMLVGVWSLVALVGYSPGDPSLNTATDGPVRNLMGRPGATLADIAMQSFGLAAMLGSFALAGWGWRVAAGRRLRAAWLRIGLLPVALGFAAVGLAAAPAPQAWPLAGGLGGAAGMLLLGQLQATALALGLAVGKPILGLSAGLIGITILVATLGMSRREWRAIAGAVGWLSGGAWRISGRGTAAAADAVAAAGKAGRKLARGAERREPRLGGAGQPSEASRRRDRLVAPRGGKPRRAAAARQRSLDLASGDDYRIPPLNLLHLPSAAEQSGRVDEDALSKNARLLETVLQDFGVSGEIVKVRPGPVVTLYELEPAPGIKSSRVIGLADDIARSMSAVAARVAIVPGRNAIGIELPNDRREMVVLREMIEASDFEETDARLALALGKNIGGEPIIVDLARMPHLLIAGTTGSGKSVGINTMILSLLYRLSPDQCKFIMIDPKMLELSVYDGI